MKRLAVALVAVSVLLAGSPPARAEITNPYPPTTERDPARVLVQFRPGTPEGERSATHQQNQGQPETTLRPEDVDVVRIPSGDSVDSALSRYRNDPDVSFAEPNARYSIDAVPNDPNFADLWGLNNTGQSGGRSDADIDAPEGWDLTGPASGSPWPTGGYAVGVIDTGIYAAHPDLAGKVITPCFRATSGAGTLADGCEDDHGHGTHVSGTIAAVANNGQGVAGVAWGARIYMCKALDASGSGSSADVAACVNELVARKDTHNIRVISLSLGGTHSLTLEAAVAAAAVAGVLVVAAAGNNGNSTVRYPAGYAAAVSVGATDRGDARASFSNFNPKVEVSAPGVGVLSTVPPSGSLGSSSGYRTASGTSMATPHAAGVAALISAQTGRTGQALRDALGAATDDLGAFGRDDLFGFGRVNLCRALGGSCTYSPGPPTSPAPTAEPSPAPGPTPVPSRTPRPRRNRPAPTPEPTFGPAPSPGPAPAPGGKGTLSGAGFSGSIPKNKVKVLYSGPKRGSARTRHAGIYSVTLRSGRYTLSARLGSVACRAGADGGPTTLTVDIHPGDRQTVNWFC